jgi:uncharacterized protein YciI
MATFTVTTLVDENDGGATEAAPLGAGLSLREALVLANADAGTADVITFQDGLSGTIVLIGGELAVFSDVTIDGDTNHDDAADITINAFGNSRVFFITAGTSTIDALTITGGAALGPGLDGLGGGIFHAGADLTIANSTIVDNIAGYKGGGIFNSGSVGSYSGPGTLTLINSTISGNKQVGNVANAAGGGLVNESYATATLINTTVAGNYAAGRSGGIDNFLGTLDIINSTISGNESQIGSGGITNSAALTLSNSIVAGNEVDGGGIDDIASSGTVVFNGVNIFSQSGVGDSEDIDGAALSDIFATVGANPFTGVQSGTLALNGGPVETIAIKQGGVAHDAGEDAAARYDDDHDSGTPDVAISTDARGAARVSGTQVDVGAHELQATPSDLLVTTLADGGADAFNNGDILAETADGGGLSLREALALANGTTGIDHITFDPTLDGGTIVLTLGQLSISSNLTVDGDVNGDDVSDITISGDADGSGTHNAADSRVFNITAGATTLDALVITGGYEGLGFTDRGGAIRAQGATSLTVANSTITGNSAYAGGGIAMLSGTLTMTHSVVSGNYAFSSGGGIHSRNLTTLTGTTVADNETSGLGGGIYANSALELTNSTIDGNKAFRGGGVFSFDTITAVNTTVSGNYGNGGGIYANAANLTHVTFSGNANGIYHSGALTLTNSIVAGNGGFEIFGSGSTSFTGLNIVGTGTDTNASDHVIQVSSLTDVFAVVGNDPHTGVQSGQLADNGGPVETIALTTSWLNPAVDAGDDSLSIAPTDARGEARTDLPHTAHNGANISDLGAFEAQAPFEAESLVVTTADDVVDWTDGVTSLREALLIANSADNGGDALGDGLPDVITFDAALNGQTLVLTGGALSLTSDVTIDGDVDGDNVADITISGDADQSGSHNAADSRVFNITAGAAILDALVITGGYEGLGFTDRGGAIRAQGTSLAVANSTITGNSAYAGGGIAMLSGTLTMTNSDVSGNYAFSRGGGIYARNLTTLTDTTVADNEAGSYGGGIFANSVLELTSSTIDGNKGFRGGGVFSFDTITAVNTTVSGNYGNGAGIYANAANLTHVTFSGNANGIYHSGALTLTNSIVVGNGGLEVFGGGSTSFTGLNIVGTGTDTDASDHVIQASALADVFAVVGNDPHTGVQSGLLAANGGPVETIALATSPLNPALDAGDDNLGVTTDARGIARPSGAHVDLGAFEVQPALALVVTTLDDELDSTDSSATIDDFGGVDDLSLREALVLASQDLTTADTITFDVCGCSNTITLNGTELVISSDVTISGDMDGDGRADIVIDADGNSRVFHITGGRVGLDAMVITGGNALMGGGILIEGGAAATITNTVITGNSATNFGGGILNAGITILLNSALVGNESERGGGIFNAGSGTVTVTNTTLSGNTASAGDGGGLLNLSGRVELTHSTVSGNDAAGRGGGMFSVGSTTVTNSIIAGNEASSSPEMLAGGSGGFAGVNVLGLGSDTDASDHIIQAPTLEDLFAHVGINPVTGVLSGVLADNGGAVPTIAIKASGTAHNAGDDAAAAYNHDGNSATPKVALTTDARGFARAADSHVDIGAVELQPPKSFVVTTLEDELGSLDPNATLADFGGLADLSLREALVLAQQDPLSADTITFASSLIGGQDPGVNDGVLVLTGGDLVIRGNVTIDGDIGGNGTAADITLQATGASRVLSIYGGTSTFNGLILTGGYADYGGAVAIGAYASGSASVTISNSTIEHNDAAYAGGGIYVGSRSSLTLSNSTVHHNDSDGAGGGIANYGTARIVNSAIDDNASYAVGGGLHNTGTLTLIGTTVSNNTAGGNGGGLYNSSAPCGCHVGSATILNSTFEANSTAAFGGGIASFGGALELTNTTLYRNAAETGGGLASYSNHLRVTSSTVSGNFAAYNAGGIASNDTSAILTNSIVAGNGTVPGGHPDLLVNGLMTFAGVNLFSEAGVGRAGTDIHAADLPGVFATVVTLDPNGTVSGDEFAAGALANNGGPVKTIAIRQGVAVDAGLDSALPTDDFDLDGDHDSGEPLPVDARGLVREFGSATDIGAYELNNVPPTIDLDGPGGGTGFATTFNENGNPAAVVDTDVTIADGNDADLASATVVLTNAQAGDVLAVDSAFPAGITAAVDTAVAGKITVTLTGPASLDTFASALKLVTFHNTSDAPSTVARTLEITVNDGAVDSAVATTTISVTAVNDAPTNLLTAVLPLQIEANTATAIPLSIADPDSAALTTTLSVTHGTLTAAALGGAGVTGSGTGTVTITGTVDQINAALGSGNLVYEGAHDYFGSDTLHMVTSDGALSDTDDFPITLNTWLVGTSGNNSYTALPGNERIDAGTGTDTITFNFKLTEASVTYSGNQVIIDGPTGSHTVTSGFEVFNFTDGTVHNDDGNPLVDDLFYYSQNHDVWNAHVEADTHYAQFGWHERRDPSAFFSTTTYLALNSDVKAANINPLDHWHAVGWQEGRLPSLAFDGAKYLAENTDVAAAHIDPLAHFLFVGASEGRQPIAPTRLVSSNGFDAVYYLKQNPDVAAAEIDPFWHFQAVGWKEGRDPNAFFDVSGYLATYTDVKAAGINPLDHYNVAGWKEGRDPSLDFDTNAYLANYTDVKAAQINPLTHFLQAGIDEHRSAFADGVWA